MNDEQTTTPTPAEAFTFFMNPKWLRPKEQRTLYMHIARIQLQRIQKD